VGRELHGYEIVLAADLYAMARKKEDALMGPLEQIRETIQRIVVLAYGPVDERNHLPAELVQSFRHQLRVVRRVGQWCGVAVCTVADDQGDGAGGAERGAGAEQHTGQRDATDEVEEDPREAISVVLGFETRLCRRVHPVCPHPFRSERRHRIPARASG